MKQDDINDMEWRNPANWSGRGPLALYSSKRDTRFLVPKAAPGLGLTLNCGHPACVQVMIGAVVIPLVLAAAIYL